MRHAPALASLRWAKTRRCFVGGNPLNPPWIFGHIQALNSLPSGLTSLKLDAMTLNPKGIAALSEHASLTSLDLSCDGCSDLNKVRSALPL